MTGIQWTEKVWNPTTGCDRVSPGCDHCYAMTMAKRLKGMGQVKYQRDGDPRTSGPGFGLTTHPDVLGLPLTWRKPSKVFVNSMSDLFHHEVPDEFITRVFAVMAATPQHTYQVLTKRHGRMKSLLRDEAFAHAAMDLSLEIKPVPVGALPHGDTWPLPNVWLGVSAEDQKRGNLRIPPLIDTPAAVRFASCEPLITPVNLYNVFCTVELSNVGLDWVIVGGESGPGARPCDPEWVRTIVGQCRDAGIAVFVKQLGSVWAQANGADPKGGDPQYWPADLRVREYPTVAVERAS